MSRPAAGEITVRRCVVRVVRRGGWSWGPDPHSLVRQAIDAIPDLLAERFGDLLAGDGPDVEITEPVVLSVRWGRSHPPGSGLPAELVVEPAPDLSVEQVSTVDTVALAASPAGTIAGLFTELAARGELATVLALLPTPSLRSYLAAALDTGDVPGADSAAVEDDLPADVLDDIATELTRRLSRPPLSRPTRQALADLVASLPASAPSPATQEAPHTEGAPSDVVTAPPAVVTASPEAVGETRVGSVLPFLLPGPLARTGYLDAIGPAMSGVGLLADAPMFAAALAYQVLGTPARGWRRTPEDDAAAAAFAGLESVPHLARFAGQVRPALPMLDAVLALSLCRGHQPADPLLVTGVDEGLLLVDAAGMFPVAWAPRVADLLPHWTAAGRPPVLVCDSPLPPATLRDLAGVGADLVTDVRPLRGDPLTRLPWRTPLWTNGAPPVRLAAELPDYADRLSALVDALFVSRFAVRGTALDRSAALAASLGLGLVAWTLWRTRETPDPLLTLTRFADLTATIRFTPRAVRVRVPLGRRHTDLWQAGLLTDVPNVVWLGGRTLTFSGG